MIEIKIKTDGGKFHCNKCEFFKNNKKVICKLFKEYLGEPDTWGRWERCHTCQEAQLRNEGLEEYYEKIH
jgi:hypothetical protein